jgi:hypothetical protein
MGRIGKVIDLSNERRILEARAQGFIPKSRADSISGFSRSPIGVSDAVRFF